jgi:SAM-dependent methyltransferase
VAEAEARGLAARAHFRVFDCGGPLPFEDASFEAVLCIDAICHLPDRFSTLAEWGRVLRPGGRLLFTDPAVLTGAVARDEMGARAAAAFFLFVPPGLDEKAIEAAGLSLLRCEDTTAGVAEIAARWHEARLLRAKALQGEEGVSWFEQRQRFLEVTAELARSRRLSRFLYLARKPETAEAPTPGTLRSSRPV